MAKILKNTTVSDIELKEIGLTVPGSGQITVDTTGYLLLAQDTSITELTALINVGDIVVNDGVQDLTVTNGIDLDRAIDFLKHPDTAFNSRFLSETERSNGFASKNVQEAIEESRNSAIGALLSFPFLTTGNVSNKWLGTFESSFTSDTVPLIVPQDSDLKGVTFTNKDDNIDIDCEVYKNGVLVTTVEIRNKRYYWKAGITPAVSFSQGDRLSVFLKKVTEGTGDSTAQDPIIQILLKLVNEQPGEGGSQNGV